MASKLKTQEVILQSPNGLVEKTLKLNDDGTVSIDAPIKQNGYYIVDYGSNANGEYTKFSDGTQICTKRHSIPANAGNSDIVWSSPFINADYRCFGQNIYSNTPIVFLSMNALNTTTTRIYAYKDTALTIPNVILDINVVAIGRWK